MLMMRRRCGPRFTQRPADAAHDARPLFTQNDSVCPRFTQRPADADDARPL